MLVADNLDLCCQVIEKAAGERAQREIDERLQGAYAARVRAKAAGQPYADAALLGGRFPGALPEALRPRPGQLTPQQQRVYEDFARIPRTAAAAQQSAGQPRPAGGLGQPGEGGEAGVPGGVPPGAGLPGPRPGGPGAEVDQQAVAAGAAGLAPPQPQPDLRSRFISWLQRMDLAIAKDPQALLASLSDGSGGGQLRAACMHAAEAMAFSRVLGPSSRPAHPLAAHPVCCSWLPGWSLLAVPKAPAPPRRPALPAEVKVLVSEIAAIPTSEATALEVAKNIFAKVGREAGGTAVGFGSSPTSLPGVPMCDSFKRACLRCGTCRPAWRARGLPPEGCSPIRAAHLPHCTVPVSTPAHPAHPAGVPGRLLPPARHRLLRLAGGAQGDGGAAPAGGADRLVCAAARGRQVPQGRG